MSMERDDYLLPVRYFGVRKSLEIKAESKFLVFVQLESSVLPAELQVHDWFQ